MFSLRRVRGKERLSGMNSEAPTVFRLTAYHRFKASHTLEGFRIPHFHLWNVSVEFEHAYPLPGDRVVDLVVAEAKLREITGPLHDTLLDHSLGVSPTSENLCVWIWDRLQKSLPESRLSAVSVTLCDLEGHPGGRAELRR